MTVNFLPAAVPAMKSVVGSRSTVASVSRNCIDINTGLTAPGISARLSNHNVVTCKASGTSYLGREGVTRINIVAVSIDLNFRLGLG